MKWKRCFHRSLDDPRPSGTGRRFAKLSRSNVAELHGSHKVHRQGSPLCTVPHTAWWGELRWAEANAITSWGLLILPKLRVHKAKWCPEVWGTNYLWIEPPYESTEIIQVGRCTHSAGRLSRHSWRWQGAYLPWQLSYLLRVFEKGFQGERYYICFSIQENTYSILKHYHNYLILFNHYLCTSY